MATGRSEVASDEVSDFQCFTCTNKTAVKYCVECQGYLCQSCSDFHSRFPSMKGHTLLEKSNSQALGSSATLKAVPTERCDIHTTKLLDMYCKDHDEVGCTTCMALTHRSCKDVHSIPDDIDILFQASEIKDVNKNLQHSKGALKHVGQKKDALLADLHSSRHEANIAIEKAKQEIIDHVATLEKKSKDEVENLYQNINIRLEKEKKEADHQIYDLQTAETDLKSSEGNKAQQFVCMKIASRKIKEANKVGMSSDAEAEAKVTFLSDSNVQAYFRTMKAFGTVSSLMPTTKRTEPYTVEQSKDMNVKLQQDSTSCNIYDSFLTEDGTLLMVDHNNKKLKRANITNMIIDGYCSFDKNPYCVCCTNVHEAVVTFYSYTNFIQFVSLGNQLTPSMQVKMNHYCLGIAYKEDKLYITDNAQTIYIHDMTGNELQAISRDSSGKDLFSNTIRIAFMDSMQSMCVADYRKGVLIFDGKYQQVTSFSDSEWSGTSSVCTDRRGNIFVCGNSSHNVFQIGYDGKKRGIVVDKSHGLQYNPQSVCFDHIHRRLVVTQNNDIVKIFDLK